MNDKINDNKRLGRGLSALLGEDVSYETIKQISIDQIIAGKFQPRKNFADTQLQELVESVKIKGVIQPIILRKIDNHYECVAGERRLRAAKLAYLTQIPAIIKSYNDQETLEIAILENLHRQDLNPIEEAEAYSKLMNEFQHTQESLAKLLGKNRSTLANTLRLLSLPENVQEMVRKGELSASHARNLIGDGDAEKKARTIISQGLSVRAIENTKNKSIKNKNAQFAYAVDLKDLEKQIMDKHGIHCQCEWNGKNGKIILKINDLDLFNDIIDKLR